MQVVLLDQVGDDIVAVEHTAASRPPGAGEARVNIHVAGVNFMDLMAQRGFATAMPVPFALGVEGAGIVESVGEGVSDLKPGDRVAWLFARGSYAEQVTAPAGVFVPVPDDIDDETAAALMMQGMTASHLATESYAIKPGDVALVHSAAGGLGLLLTQVVKALGGTVIGRVSSEAKVAAAKAAGADEVVVSADGDFADEVLKRNGGRGVHVAYDGAGADTFYDSLKTLKPHGVLCYYGQLIKRLPPIDLLDLPNSVLVTYSVVHHHTPTRAALLARSAQLFQWVREGRLRVTIGGRYALSDFAQAHTDIQSRRTIGKLLLYPDASPLSI